MSVDLFRVDGKVAVVTGGSRGLGLIMAEGLLLGGAAKIYVSSRGKEACDKAAVSLNEMSKSKGCKGEVIAIAADSSTSKGVNSLFEAVSAKEEKIDILLANAGATWGAPFGEHPEKAIDKVLSLNVKGVFLTIQAFTPLLEKAGTLENPSRIVITGSVAGLRSGMSGGTYGYLASKAAVHHIGKTLAVELGPSHITVNSIAPGFFPTRMTEVMLDTIGNEMVATNPLRRLGEPNDLIGLILYLCSKAGSYINGAVIPVDGGQYLSGKL